MRHLILPVCLMAFVLSAKWASAQVTDAIQKLLPATVAVELKTVHQIPMGDSSSKDQTVPRTEINQELAKSLSMLAQQPYAETIQLTKLTQPVDAVSYASGTVVSADGGIVTMIGDVGKGTLTVTLAGGKQVPARLLVDDQRSGLQLIKVDVDDLSPAKVSMNDDLLLGQQVATVVSTDVNDRAAAAGIVTALGRSVDGIAIPLIQTDVAIGPMSAGAPLANMDGELVGIWIAKKDDAADTSFAVPAKFVRQLVEARGQRDHTVLKRGYLGIRLNDEDENADGPRITEIMNHSAAQDAGLMVGDEILAINGQLMNRPRDVVATIGQHAEGDQIEATIRREGEERKIVAKLRDFPVSTTEPRYAEAAHEWKRGKLYGIDADGKIRVWDLADGAVVPFAHDPQRPLTADHLKYWIDLYTGKVPEQVAPATVRVQRSDVEKKLDELTRRVISLQSEVEKLTGELKSISKNLKEE